jgi:hypothetical protein
VTASLKTSRKGAFEEIQALVKATLVQVRASLIAARRRSLGSLQNTHAENPEGAHDASDDE